MQAKRRWFQFSLRTLVVVMLLVSLVLGYWGYARRRAQRQWEAVRAIREAGGTVDFKHMVGDDPYDYESLNSISPTWQKRLGIECPPTVAEVDLPWTNGSDKKIVPHLRQLRDVEAIILYGDWGDDEFLKTLSKFPSLNRLSIMSDQITDAGVLSIAGNKKLESLHIYGKQLTDCGMAVVAKLPELKNLTWESANTTGEGLMHLRHHPQLSNLNILGTTASDVGFEHLSTCPNLEELSIDGPNTLTGRGISALARLNLKYLVFSESPLSKDAIVPLSDLTTLKDVTLTGPLSAEDLAHLSSLVELQYLGLEECKLTREGFEKLTPLKQLANLNVDMTGLADEDMEILTLFTELRLVVLRHNSAVTDVGLMKLVGMKQLTGVDIEGTKITSEGVKEFKRLAPNVGVYGSPEN